MFNFLKKDPLKKTEDLYKKKLTKAMNAQRSGDIQEFARLSSEAEIILKELEEMKNKR
jgi:hypothetical protein